MSRIGKLPISIPAGVTVAQGQDGFKVRMGLRSGWVFKSQDTSPPLC